MCSVTVPEAGCPQSRCRWRHAPSEISRGRSVLASARCRQLQPVLGLWQCHSGLSLAVSLWLFACPTSVHVWLCIQMPPFHKNTVTLD